MLLIDGVSNRIDVAAENKGATPVVVPSKPAK
jgi:hypothetical protein